VKIPSFRHWVASKKRIKPAAVVSSRSKESTTSKALPPVNNPGPGRNAGVSLVEVLLVLGVASVLLMAVFVMQGRIVADRERNRTSGSESSAFMENEVAHPISAASLPLEDQKSPAMVPVEPTTPPEKQCAPGVRQNREGTCLGWQEGGEI
jgi:hypothetical protein